MRPWLPVFLLLPASVAGTEPPEPPPDLELLEYLGEWESEEEEPWEDPVELYRKGLLQPPSLPAGQHPVEKPRRP